MEKGRFLPMCTIKRFLDSESENDQFDKGRSGLKRVRVNGGLERRVCESQKD